MKLPLVSPFIVPYEVWLTREPTWDERRTSLATTGRSCGQIKVSRVAVIKSEIEAANRICNVKYDPSLRQHVNTQLDSLASYKAWMQATNWECPDSLITYQQNYPNYDIAVVEDDIKSFGLVLSEGQVLFHAGAWPAGQTTFQTTEPFSTSFCPEAAFRNAEHKAKAYNAGKLDLLVITVKSTSANVFPYPRVGQFAHENEVLFSSGITLTKVNSSTVDTNFRVIKDEYSDKYVAVSVVEVELT
ncbi:hypothetical protein [Vibrio nigripulchritudo]|uniref:hypothetical protein n=1 Tax=Vibrio nigripulchritudo TaxID=28173 RepID=UPI0024909B82|nr:hypothetical protein [Vibrio nigripulchritudo]BDU37348.1 hypothetical protein TUMSATVNIG2_18170 [Vibrio nigripulchritudo]BDU43068.1 hypothetical protein TUMSATVNIG3_18660 [Vibrio nigripulchritudo]